MPFFYVFVFRNQRWDRKIFANLISFIFLDKRRMALNASYAKSVEGILKFLEIVSNSDI